MGVILFSVCWETEAYREKRFTQSNYKLELVSLIRTSRALVPPKGAFWRELPEWHQTTVLHPGLLPSGISVPVFTGKAGPPCTLHCTVEIAYSFKATEEQL